MTLLQMSVSAALIIVAAIIIRAVALDRLPKQIFQCFWLLAVARLLIPFSFPSKLSIFNLLKQAPIEMTAWRATPSGVAAGTTTQMVAPMAAAQPAEAVSPLLIIWVVGLVAIAGYFVVVNIRCRRELAQSLPVEHRAVNDWLTEHKLRRKISVRSSDKITTPLTFGAIKPVILLPATFDCADTQQLDQILTHEWLHIKRLDTLKTLVAMVAVCVHWFNPLVWAMYVLLKRDIELACDEGVLRRMGADTSVPYALTLIQMQEQKKTAELANSLSRYAIKERIESIMKYKKASVVAIILALVLVVGVTTAFASGAVPNQTENTPTNVEIQADVMVYRDKKTGMDEYSVDGGKTWMSEAEWEKNMPMVEWWTVQEFEQWLMQERVDIQQMIGDRGWSSDEGWYTWTQKRVDETIAMYEEQLRLMREGQLFSKSVAVVGDDAISVVEDDAISVAESATMVEQIGSGPNLLQAVEEDMPGAEASPKEANEIEVAEASPKEENETEVVEDMPGAEASPKEANEIEVAEDIPGGRYRMKAMEEGDGVVYEDNTQAFFSRKGENAPILSEVQAAIASEMGSDAEIYTPYERYGLSYDEKTDTLHYKNKRVRFFQDDNMVYDENNEGSGSITTHYPNQEGGEIDIYAVRNIRGKLTGLRVATDKEFDARTPEMDEWMDYMS